MLMKRLSLGFLLLLAASGVRADGGDMLYAYRRTAAAPTRFALADLDKITFTESDILFTGRNSQTAIPFDEFSYIKFSADYVVPVEPVKEAKDDVSILFESARGQVVVEASSPLGGVAVYDLRGRLVAADRSAAARYVLSLAAAPRGLYLVHVAGEGRTLTRKIVKP